MNENRERLLNALRGINQELLQVQACTQEMEEISTQLCPEVRPIASTTIRAKLKQAAASLFIAMPAVCAVQGLLSVRIDEVFIFAVMTALAYLFFKPERYRDKSFGVLSVVLGGIGLVFLKATVDSLPLLKPHGWLAENHPVIAGALAVFWFVLYGGSTAAAYVLLSKKRVRRNAEIAEENKVIRARNQEARERYARVEKTRDVHSQRLTQLCGNWFPMNYCCSYAVSHFIQFMENYQADSIKELVNLFETSEYRRRVEEAQLQTQRDIQFMTLNNMINAQRTQDTINRRAKDIQNTIDSNGRRISDAIWRL